MADACQSATPFAYEADRMYGAERAFAAGSRHEWLRGERPRILRLDDTRLLSIDFGAIPIPRRSIYDRLWKIPCYKGRRRRRVKTGDLVPRGYNPSIVRAPAGLCDGCAFVVAVRADTLHQCTGPGAISTGFAGTAIAVLDERLCLLAWTWLNVMPCQKDCIHPDGSRCAFAYALNTTPPPPWSLCTWRDVRLLNVAGRLLATYIGGSSRELFLFAHLHLEAQRHRTELKLRAWVARSHRPVHHAPWLLGRSQGLFVDRPLDEPGLLHLHVQPWLHLIGTLGTVAWRTRRRPSAFDAASKRMSERLVLSPASASAPLLVHNDTALLQHELWGGARGARERPLLSTTTHLIRIAAPRPGRRPCEALLGIGHLHRVPSNDSTAWGTAMVGCTPRPPATFRFGAQYTAEPRLILTPQCTQCSVHTSSHCIVRVRQV